MQTATTPSETPSKTSLPPGSRLPKVVQTGWFLSRPRSCLEAMRERHGDTFTMQVMNGTVVMGCTPAHAKQLFTADPSHFLPFAVGALEGVLGKGSVLLAWGEQHRKQRKLLQPPFHGARMRAYGQAMQEVALAHTRSLRPGDELRAHDVTTRISLDVILRAVFGVEGQAIEEGRRVLRSVLEGFSPLIVFTRHLQTPLFAPWRAFVKAQQTYVRLVDDIVRARRASKQHGDDIVGMLLDATYEDGSPMSEQDIRDQLLTLLVAGHETTAISLAWAVHDVFRRPAVLSRLRDEVAPLGPTPDPEALARLPYLSAVCDESLRYRPIVTDVLRTIAEPFSYGGHLLPIGATAAVAIELIHRDPSIYPSPDEFRPERFLERKPGPFEFLPFGGGHRRCLGAAFSDYEARIVLGTIVSQLDLEPLCEDERVRRNVTMGPRKGVPVRVVRRLSGAS